MKKIGLSGWILIAFVLGGAVGIFFGEAVAFLQVGANAFIALLQMAVLPYIVVSLTAGLGRLTLGQAGLVARAGGLSLLILWLLTLAVLLGTPLTVPNWESASFFSTTLALPVEPIDFVALYIPANPFHALSENVVPAVVLFSIVVGVALLGVEGRETLVDTLDVLTAALTRVTNFVVALSPLGVFAIAASAAGTMTIEEFGRLQVHIVGFAVASLVLTFWLIPGAVAALTPVPYREVIWVTRDALVTAFSTGSLFVVLPILAERAKELLEKHEARNEQADAVVDVLVPVSFNFPSAGKLLLLSFVPFAAWLSGSALPVAEYPSFVTTGVFSFFGNVNAAIPYLLDLFRIPADTFHLFVAVNVVTGRFSTLVAAMHTFALTILSAALLVGRLRFRAGPVLRYALVSLAVVFGSFLGVRLFFEHAVSVEYRGEQKVAGRRLLREPVAFTVVDEPAIRTDSRPGSGAPALERIRARGRLRVGISDDAPPMSYVNQQGEPVGFDIEMMHALARDLGVELELVVVHDHALPDHLVARTLDVTRSVPITTDRFTDVLYAESHLEMTLAFVVLDHRRAQFASRKALRAQKGILVGVPGSTYYARLLQKYLPNAEVVVIDRPGRFFEEGTTEDGRPLDALLTTAEIGSAWTLLFPRYSVVVPQPDIVRAPIAYAVSPGESEFARFLSAWVVLKKADGTVDDAYRYWVLGQDDAIRPPRWSVARDVLGWID